MRTRFAPSPTGPLHLGHAFSALTAQSIAQRNNGVCLLRIEDIDKARSKPHWEAQILSDLKWIGFNWSEDIIRQSDHLAEYASALDDLWNRGLLYPCHCNRRDITNALSAPQEGAPMGPDGVIYPGTCRTLERPTARPDNVNLRLDMAKAVQGIDALSFCETLFETTEPTVHKIDPSTLPERLGDVVLSRKDMGTSYHLSVVIDDAAQGITDVVRGEDLFDATQIHVLLQHLLGLPTPTYHHHRLIRDDDGKRLAKRDDARSLEKFRQDGDSPQDLRRTLGLAD